MKKTLRASLMAAPLLVLSSIASAAESAAEEPMALTSHQMDNVTAGTYGNRPWRSFLSNQKSQKTAQVVQINISPVFIFQLGNNNYAVVYSGNFSSIFQ